MGVLPQRPPSFHLPDPLVVSIVHRHPPRRSQDSLTLATLVIAPRNCPRPVAYDVPQLPCRCVGCIVSRVSVQDEPGEKVER